jgi:hypothetical protein
MARFASIRPLAVLAAAVGGLAAAAPAPAPQPAAEGKALNVSLYCISLGHGRFECQYDVTGGNGVYTYSWNPTPTIGGNGGGTAIVRCNAYQYRTVSLTVSDSNGQTGSASGSFYCGDAV